MKLEMRSYGARRFNVHCPRCGHDEWSEEEYNSGVNIYHKCLHCGADVAIGDRHTLCVVIEQPYYEFTEHTYDVIRGKDGVKAIGWKQKDDRRVWEEGR